jgi:hypothetical protein
LKWISSFLLIMSPSSSIQFVCHYWFTHRTEHTTV